MPEPVPSADRGGDLRVVIADDHYLVREGTRQLLQLGGGVDVVDGVATAVELLASVARHLPDVVVTDIRMPPTHGTEGIDAARRIRAEFPDIGVVVLSHHADPEYALALFSDGTTGLAYLLKERIGDREELLRAVRDVAAGGSVIDPLVVESLVSRRSHEGSSRLSTLTDREREVLEDMAAGYSNIAIGERRHLSVSAVEKNVGSILDKLGIDRERGVHRRVSAVLAYLSASTGPD